MTGKDFRWLFWRVLVGSKAMDPGRFILICLAGWLNREQQDVIEYLREEIRVLRA